MRREKYISQYRTTPRADKKIYSAIHQADINPRSMIKGYLKTHPTVFR